MNRKIFFAIFLLTVLLVGAGCGALGGGNPTPSGDDEPTRAVTGPTDTPAPTNTEIPFTQVVIAIQDIPRGVVIAPDMVSLIRFPVESAPEGAITNLDDAIGLIASTDIYREEILIARKLVRDINALGSTGSDAAAVLDPNRVAISVPMDEITSVAYALQPGDFVDVIVSMLFVDVDQDFQTILPNNMLVSRYVVEALQNEDGTTTYVRSFDLPSTTYNNDSFESRTIQASDAFAIAGQGFAASDTFAFPVIIQPSSVDAIPGTEYGVQRPRLVTQRTVTNAQVVWVGYFPEDGRIFAPAATSTPVATPTDPADADSGESGNATPVNTPVPPRPTIITLAVSSQDAVVLTYMAEAGIPMTFALRSARTQGLPDTNPVNLQYIMGNYNITPPDRLAIALDPPIRSIRGITLRDISVDPNATEEPAADN